MVYIKRRILEENRGRGLASKSLRLPAAVANGVVVTTCPGTTAATATSTTTTATSPAATTATTTAVAAHLVQARVNLLLRLRKDLDKIASLLGVCEGG